MSHPPPADTRRNFRGAGKIAPASLRGRLAAALTQLGLRRVAEIVGTSQNTILRLAAGGGVRHGTICAVQVAIDRIESEMQRPTAATESAPPAPPPRREP